MWYRCKKNIILYKSKTPSTERETNQDSFIFSRDLYSDAKEQDPLKFVLQLVRHWGIQRGRSTPKWHTSVSIEKYKLQGRGWSPSRGSKGACKQWGYLQYKSGSTDRCKVSSWITREYKVPRTQRPSPNYHGTQLYSEHSCPAVDSWSHRHFWKWHCGWTGERRRTDGTNPVPPNLQRGENPHQLCHPLSMERRAPLVQTQGFNLSASKGRSGGNL